MKNIKIIPLTIILILLINIRVAAYEDNSYRFSVANTYYKMELPSEWKAVEHEDRCDELLLYKEQELKGVFYLNYKEAMLISPEKLNELETVMGRASIYKVCNDENKEYQGILAIIKSGDRNAALYLKADPASIDINNFLVKMLLINISRA